MAEKIYQLHPAQYKIYSDPARFVILAAGRRFGKTYLALTKIIANAARKNKARIFYVAPTYRQAEMIAWKMLLEMLPPELIVSKNEVRLEVTLKNKSEISLKGADNEDSLRGVGLDFVVLDEYGMMKPNVWQEIIRPMLTDRRGSALFIGTPAGKNHFWELWMKGQKRLQNYSSYQFKTEDNPYIPRSEIVEAKEQLNDRYFRQEYEASFEDFTGLIWPEYSELVHVVEPFDLPTHWEQIAAIDTAVTGTTASLFARIDEDGTVFVSGEYYEQNKRVSEVCEVIKRRSNYWLIDPASKIKNKERLGQLFSLYDEYSENGVIADPAENDVDGGINRVAEYFKSDKIKIFRTCRNLIHELERYHWSEERETSQGILRPVPFKALDHACDCLRYIIMSRPKVSSILKAPPKGLTEKIYLEGQELEMAEAS